MVRSTTLDEFLKTDPTAAEIRALISPLSKDVSDHMPVVTRVTFDDPGGDDDGN